jgi:DNA-binding XRE family transcriptional regulator
MKADDLAGLTRLLRAGRAAKHLTQEDAADHLGISRKTYLLMESRRWLPQARERSHFARRLRELHAPAADEFVRLFPEAAEDDAEAQRRARGVAELGAAQAKLVFDSAVLGVAEELEQSPRLVRALVAAILERLHAGGMPMAQAAAIAKAPIAKGAK